MDAVIFKGDANYRRLLGDRKWNIQTPLTSILHPWAPTNLIALRTLKFSVAAGIDMEAAQDIIKANKDWMTSGKWGVIQVVDKSPRVFKKRMH